MPELLSNGLWTLKCSMQMLLHEKCITAEATQISAFRVTKKPVADTRLALAQDLQLTHNVALRTMFYFFFCNYYWFKVDYKYRFFFLFKLIITRCIQISSLQVQKLYVIQNTWERTVKDHDARKCTVLHMIIIIF